MFFCILFNYTILRDTKDVLMITAPKSGAEVIPFIKTYVNLPAAIVSHYKSDHINYLVSFVIVLTYQESYELIANLSYRDLQFCTLNYATSLIKRMYFIPAQYPFLSFLDYSLRAYIPILVFFIHMHLLISLLHSFQLDFRLHYLLSVIGVSPYFTLWQKCGDL